MTGRSGFDRQRDRLEIAHFTHQNNIRIFAQRTAQCGGEGFGMQADLTVVYDAPLALMHKLDGVLDRYDMILARAVGHINNGCQGGGFAAAGGSGYQHQAPGESRQF